MKAGISNLIYPKVPMNNERDCRAKRGASNGNGNYHVTQEIRLKRTTSLISRIDPHPHQPHHLGKWPNSSNVRKRISKQRPIEHDTL